jgi:hypothetical protein
MTGWRLAVSRMSSRGKPQPPQESADTARPWQASQSALARRPTRGGSDHHIVQHRRASMQIEFTATCGNMLTSRTGLQGTVTRPSARPSRHVAGVSHKDIAQLVRTKTVAGDPAMLVRRKVEDSWRVNFAARGGPTAMGQTTGGARTESQTPRVQWPTVTRPADNTDALLPLSAPRMCVCGHPVFDDREPRCPLCACGEHKPRLVTLGDRSAPASVLSGPRKSITGTMRLPLDRADGEVRSD